VKLFFHFAVTGFSNSYLIGPEEGGDALLVDPGVMDSTLLQLIESNSYYLKHILVTHSHESHTKGIKTLQKIYDAKIHAKEPTLYSFPTSIMEDDHQYDLSGIEVHTIDVKGHSHDHLVYRIGNMLFTGDILSAGQAGDSEGALERAVLLNSIRDRILSLPDYLLIFPGHGPPSTLGSERLFNPDLQFQDQD
jgi:hydroxyacylglutathione hydrolase